VTHRAQAATSNDSAVRHLKHLGLLLAVGVVIYTATTATAAPNNIAVPLNDARVIRMGVSPAEINVSDSEIADVKMLARNRLLVSGKRLGATRVTVVDRNGAIRTWGISVVVPVEDLQTRMAEVLPRQAIQVEAVGRTVVITGTVDNALTSDRAAKIVTAHVQAVGQDAKVLNFLSIRGKQQVQLRVKIAEVSRTAMRQLGLNAWYRTVDNAGGMLAPGIGLDSNTAPDLGQKGNTLDPNAGLAPNAGAPVPVPLLSLPTSTDAFGLLFSSQANSSFPISIAVNLLQGKGLAKVLSEPTLVAYSGQKATFLVGGEFPVPIPQALGQTSIEFKKFGVQLTFTPTVLDNSKLRLKVAVSVSERDDSGSVSIQGTRVPALSSRHSETMVQLKNGQSFAIAGLLQDRIESSVSKIPLLGDIPIVGMLFRKNSFRRTESELVIMVTANLVHPLNPGEVPPLPGESEVSDPGALRFFLLGTTDAEAPVKRRRGPAGSVGFSQ
jgi:pilus assembly protein CpaC